MKDVGREGEPERKRRRLNRKEQKARKKKLRERDSKDTNSCSNDLKVTRDIPSEQEVDASYDPTPIPTLEQMKRKHRQSLGKWFPKAVVLKSALHYTNADVLRLSREKPPDERPTASILLFYQYVTNPLWSQSKVDLLMAYLIQVAEKRRNLGGRIRVAQEGVNVTLSAVDDERATAVDTLRHFCRDLKQFDKEAFKHTDFKFIDHVQADRHFKDLKLFPVQELVFYGFPKRKDDVDPAPLEKAGVHLDPEDFHEMLEQDSSNTVVVDIRNHYEASLGRFDGQLHRDAGELASSNIMRKKASGAEYIDPKMRKSTDFAKWLGKEETQQKLKNKDVMLFCTGGVRCERASAYLKNTVSNVKGVYQLKGGIEKYLQTFPDGGGYWRGKNFVFDKREAVGAGDRDGDGGVLAPSSSSATDTKCCLCLKPWDRYIGKRKCTTCGVPVLICEQCLSQKRKIAEEQILLRCPLCVEEGVTIRADEVQWTNNGVDAVSGEKADGKQFKNKAASSVLKWGGGHATSKKERRRFLKVPCKFGADCVRKGCFFAHPSGELGSNKQSCTGNNV